MQPANAVYLAQIWIALFDMQHIGLMRFMIGLLNIRKLYT